MKSPYLPVLLVILFSCSKSNSPAPTPTPTPTTRIASVDFQSALYSATYTLSYDSNGHITKLVYDGPSAYTKSYAYEGKNIYMKTVGVKGGTDTVNLNDQGLMAEHRETGQGFTVRTVFNYDAQGIVQNSVTKTNNLPLDTTRYFFTDGDLTNTLDGGLRDTTVFDQSKLAVPGNFDDFNQLIFFGSHFYTNKHLKTSYSVATARFHYLYQYDTKGNISTAEIRNDTSSVSTWTFHYTP